MATTCRRSLERGHHLFGQELQTPLDRFFGQESSRIQLSGDTGYPQHLLELNQPVFYESGAAKDDPGLQQVFIGDVG